MPGRCRRVDLGDAVSFDSVLTVLTVLLVLRMVFLVPMVNLDKAKTERARRSGIWDTTIARVRNTPVGAAAGYERALELGPRSREEGGGDGTLWIESILPDSSLVVARHDTATGRYVRMHVQSRSEVPGCRFGLLRWSRDEGVWFGVSDSVDYGQRGVCDSTLRAYRRWLSGRGLP